MNNDFETDNNGRVIKINNYSIETDKKKLKCFYYIDDYNKYIFHNEKDYKCELVIKQKITQIYKTKTFKKVLEYLMSIGNLFDTKENAEKYIRWQKIHIKLLNLYNKNKQLCDYYECKNFKQFIYELYDSEDYDFFKRILQVDFDIEDLKFYLENDY